METAEAAARVAAFQSLVDSGSLGSLSFLNLVGVSAESAADLIEQVERGLPYSAAEALQAATELPSGDFETLIGVSFDTLGQRRVAGRLHRDESDRVVRAARILADALSLFEGDRSKAAAWLSSPNRALGGETPFALTRSEVGAREVEHLIGRLEHGIPS